MGFWIVIGYLFVIVIAGSAINQFTILKKEQNELLREIIRKMDNKKDNESIG